MIRKSHQPLAWQPDAFGFLVLSVFDDFGVRLITFLALEGPAVVIWFIRFNANKPHQGATLGAFWLVENQSRWVKRLEIRHGCTTKRSRKRTQDRSRVEPPSAQFE
jgi:hypothetical protein